MEVLRKTNRLAQVAVTLALLGSPALAQTPSKAPAPGAATAPAEKPAAPTLTRAQVDALLATPAKVVFLDVRRADEISTIGGFPAYLNIQVADLDHFLAYIPKDRKVVAVSNHAHRALKAAALLKQHGFSVSGVVGAQDYAAEGGVLTEQKPVEQAKASTPAN